MFTLKRKLPFYKYVQYTIAVQDILASTMPLRHAFKKTDDNAAAAAVEVVKAEKCALIA